MLKKVYLRGLTAKSQNLRALQALNLSNNRAVVMLQQRAFASKADDAMRAEANKYIPPMEDLDKKLFEKFSVGDIKQIQSTPDHKPPSQEDTIEGRYASVLFTTAS